MSQHSYSRCWLHLIWATLHRERMFPPAAAAKVSKFLGEYAEEKKIYLKINFVNAVHVHALIDLPTNLTIEDAAKLPKGASSHWINENNVVAGRFSWGLGYGAFSVSQSDVPRVSKYIANQAEHHRIKSFAEEYERFVTVYGLAWSNENVKTVSNSMNARVPHVETRG